MRLLRRVHAHPSDVDLQVGLVHACRYCGLHDASLAAHEQAVAMDPGARTSVAYTHLQKGDWAGALRVAPANDPVRVYALQSLGRRDEALGQVWTWRRANVDCALTLS